MTIEKRTRPYELLVRWGPNGISGAHAQFIEELVEGDQVLQARPGDPIPLSLAGDAGFPLADVMHEAHVDSIGGAAAMASELSALREGLRKANAQLQDAQGALVELERQLQDAQGALVELERQHENTRSSLSTALAKIALLSEESSK
jgi:hypothetical protein